ncbi:coiled-coil domain-containing protein 187 [Hemicordylus capensis]|uniref:coiled-coil domain-containing protein 187 n=1 Tax=Hemicordylus capensis TaxID=884348 RepID=UPI00230390C8|nr:coiled-coil domain-containing protein 187 [Hemicordylus capensis]
MASAESADTGTASEKPALLLGAAQMKPLEQPPLLLLPTGGLDPGAPLRWLALRRRLLLPPDIALARASLEKARAVLQRLEGELERSQSTSSRRPRGGGGGGGLLGTRSRLEWLGSPGCSSSSSSREPADAASWRSGGSTQAREPRCPCRLKEGALEGRRKSTASASPERSPSGGPRGCQPEARLLPDPQPLPAPPSAPLPRPWTGPSGRGPAEPDKRASPLWDEASPRLAGASGSSSTPLPRTGRLAWLLRGGARRGGSSPAADEKLQKLKARIREQRRQRGPSQAPGDLCPPLRWPRKVRKTAPAVPAPTGPGGKPARAKRPGFRASPLPPPGETRPERGAGSFGASAWREGQKLARKILGPPLQHPKLRGELGWEEETAPAPGPEEELLTLPRAEQSLEEKRTACGQHPRCPATQSERERARQARVVAGSSPRWEDILGTDRRKVRLQKDPEKRTGNQQSPRRRGALTDPVSRCPDEAEASPAPDVKETPPQALLGGTGGRSAHGDGRRRSRTALRSEDSGCPTRGVSGEEDPPASSCQRNVGPDRHPYSPEEVREFMHKMGAERRKRAQAEKRRLKQAHQARDRRLRDLFRKQKEALGRKGRRRATEAWQVGGGAAPAAKACPTCGQECASGKCTEMGLMDWVHETSRALLRNEAQGTCGLHPKTASMPGSALVPEDGRSSPLQLGDLCSPGIPASPPQSPVLRADLGAAVPASPLGPSPGQNRRGDRVRAIHSLARDLGERLARETERLQLRKRPVGAGGAGGPPGGPGTPPEDFSTAALNAGPVGNASPFQSPLARPQHRREGTGPEEGAAAAAAAPKGIKWPPWSPAGARPPVWPEGSSAEEEQPRVCAKAPQEDSAAVKGFRVEREKPAEPPSPEKPTAKTGRLPPPCLAGREERAPPPWPWGATWNGGGGGVALEPEEEGQQLPASAPAQPRDTWRWPISHSLAETPPVALHQIQEGTKGPVEHLGLQSGQRSNVRQLPASGLPASPIHPPHSKAAAEEGSGNRSEASDSPSQWSAISQFYGGSGTFCRLGLAMAEQCLWQEELRARHQSALLRLRGEALWEKAQAELAWLEQEARLQGPEGAAAAAEKQSQLFTSLKQEQAEIRHLQDVCRAAQRERELLLKQQQELRRVQQATAQLWQQLGRLAGGPPWRWQAAENPTQAEGGSGGGSVLGREAGQAASRPAAPPAGGERGGPGWPQQHWDRSNLRAEGEEVLPRGAAETSPEWKPRPGVEPLRAGGPSVSLEEQREDSGLMALSKKDEARSACDKAPTPKMSLECLDSAGPSAELSASSPAAEENSLSDAKFHKACAVLVDLSGSSLSGSDLEAGDAQDTDVSLPEEFVFQDWQGGGPSGAGFPETPPGPPTAVREGSTFFLESRCRSEGSGGHSGLEGLSVICSQEKTPGGAPPHRKETCASDSVAFAKHGRQGTPSSWAGGSLSSPADTPLGGRGANCLEASAFIPGSGTVNETASPGRSKSEAVLSPSRAALGCPENCRQPNSTPAPGPADRGGGHGEPALHIEVQPLGWAQGTSLESVAQPQEGSALPASGGQRQPLPTTPSSHPSSLQPVPEICPADDREASRPEEAAPAQITGADEEAGASLLCAETPDGAVEDNQNHQDTKASGMATLPLASQAKSCLWEREAELVSKTLLPEMEDDIRSPVDEVLTYGSADLPSSTEKDASFPSNELPPPPEDLSEQWDGSNFSLKDFPSPPEQLFLPEAGELQGSTDEHASVRTLSLTSWSEVPMPKEPLP